MILKIRLAINRLVADFYLRWVTFSLACWKALFFILLIFFFNRVLSELRASMYCKMSGAVDSLDVVEEVLTLALESL